MGKVMHRRVAKVAQEYAGRQVDVGETFDVDQQDLELLIAIGRVEREDGDAVPGFVKRDVVATTPANYNTRDMVAQPLGKRQHQRKGA